MHKVAGLISTVSEINDGLIAEKREYALERIDQKITQLQKEIAQSGIATSELSNQLLRPLQLVKTDLQSQKSIPQIYMLQTDTANERVDNAHDGLNKALEEEEARRHEAKSKAEAQADGKTGGDDIKPNPAPLVKPKAVVEISVSDIAAKTGAGAYIETAEDMEQFLAELRRALETAIANDNRTRLKF